MCFNKLFLPEAKQKVSLGKEPRKKMKHIEAYDF
jgi:hypothetical protein